MFETKIKEIIAAQLGMKIDDLNDDDDIMDDLGASSLDIVEIVVEIEDVFGITVEDSAILENRRVGDACRYIASHK